jgi:hypothetical protein
MRELVNKTRKIYCGCFNITVGYLFYHFPKILFKEVPGNIFDCFFVIMALLISLEFLTSGTSELIYTLFKNIQEKTKRIKNVR